MKLPPLHPRRQLPVDSGAFAPPSAVRTPHSALRTPRSERAMALVITLILLSVITFMAIAFLVISRAEKGSVTTTTEQAIARLAADNAFERAQAELLAPIMCSGNANNYGLIVSTNFINSIGFIPGLSHPTNVNYEHTIAGTLLTQAEQLQNLTNLLYNPRPPVFLLTNRALGYTDFRFYLDLNRNGRYDTNGLLPVISADPANPFINTNGFVMPSFLAGGTVSNFFVGDPEWIGGLEFPDRHYAPDNKFVYRYAYLVVPAGNTLDLNYIHNYAKNQNQFLAYTGLDGFFRNQGVGSWEINLAAFLVDLNTNIWQTNAALYTYYWNTNLYTQPNSGVAFDDALSLLRYRYAANRGTLLSARDFFAPFGLPATVAFDKDFIDGYSAGPPMVSTVWPGNATGDADIPRVAAYPWAGANNPNRFFTTQELFDKNKTALNQPTGPTTPTFTDRLLMAGKGQSSYDRYTLYRLLSQLGTDSAPEVAPAAPKPITNVGAYGSSSEKEVTVANHGFYSGDWVTVTSGGAQQRFRISVLSADKFVLLGSSSFSISVGAGTVALDPSENAKIDLNYDNIAANRGTFTAWAPTNFFTAAADRLLRRQNGLFLNNLTVWQVATNSAGVVYTNNSYLPSVHRLLQLAANIYDATTNHGVYPYAPTVFRPLFRRDPADGRIMIVGYRQVMDDKLARAATAPPMAELETGLNMNAIKELGESFGSDVDEPLVSGVPLIVGAKKGYPNFNEFAMQNALQVSRRLQFERPVAPPDAAVNVTNQLYTAKMTNVFGVEVWNSYATNFPRKLEIITVASITSELTNEYGIKLVSNRVSHSSTRIKAPSTWPGYYNPTAARPSFEVPLLTNWTFLAFSTYSPTANGGKGGFIMGTNNVASLPGRPFYVPHWWLNLNARIRCILVADDTNIVDYVNLNHSEKTLNVTAFLNGEDANCFNASEANLWCTNRWKGAAYDDDRIPTYGVMSQILISQGLVDATWRDYNFDSAVAPSKYQSIGGFYYNLRGRQSEDYPGTYYRSNIFFAPYIPVKSLITVTKLQANDPLVHYTVGDLMNMDVQTNVFTSLQAPATANLGDVNERYEPWGFSKSSTPSVGLFELAAKDPLVSSSDAWDFPTNKFPNVGWLGRVHRGTPWQTVYLKSSGIATNAWSKWTGNFAEVRNSGQMDTNILALNATTNDFAYTLPINDRALLDIFTTAFNDNAAMGRMSVNQTNLAAWSAILSGAIVLTNATIDSDLLNNAFPQYGPLAIEPAGVYNPFAASNTYPAVARIVHGLNHVRSTTAAKAFTHLGDILAAPELTVASPFLKATSTTSQQRGISDAAYERIPQQILGLLKCDPMPRFVIYSYGQALKPADRSLITSGPFLGLCTNYQITAEVATRAVVRIEGAPKNPRAVIESFNPLPPD